MQRHIFTTSASILALSIAWHGIANADDIVINTPSPSIDLNGDDTLTITETGNISTTVTFDDAVQATGSNNAIVNKGTLRVTGTATDVIDVIGTSTTVRTTNNSLKNAGTIDILSNAGRGIAVFFSDLFTLENTGTISSNSGAVTSVIVLDSDFFRFNNSGTIESLGPASAGIVMINTPNLSVVNSGKISTTFDAFSVTNAPNSTFVNSGMVATSEDGTTVLTVGNSDFFNFNNTGTITGTGNATTGVLINNSSNFFGANSGTISTDVGLGFLGSPNATFINNGLIQGNLPGTPILSMAFSNNFSITNTGSVVALGGDNPPAATSAHAVSTFFGTNVSITNTGHIRAKGGASDGINVEEADRAIVTNNGLIVAEQPDGDAIWFESLNGQLNLLAPGYLGGTIDLSIVTDLNVTTGPSHSVSWWLPTANVTGGQANVSGTVPWYYDTTTGQFATFDPSGLAGTFNQLGDTASLLSHLGQYGLTQAESQANASVEPLAYADQTPRGGDASTALANHFGPDMMYEPASGQFWINGFGGYAGHGGDSTTLEQHVGQLGVAFGYGWHQSADLYLSVMAGYLNGNISAKSPFAKAQDIDSNGVFAGIYGDKRFGPVTLGLGLAGGWQNNSSTRFVNDNLALTGGLTLGESRATASYDSWYVTPEVSLSTDIGLGNSGVTLTPSGHIRYALQAVDGYVETGSTANAKVSNHTLGVFEGSFELALSKQFVQAKVTGRAGYLVRAAAGGDNNVPVTMLGLTNPIGIGDTNSSAAYIGTSADFALTPQASFVLDGQAMYSNSIKGVKGTATLAVSF